ncbi:MAG: hypothetical protein KC766_11350 [Myxococcales bacterium]|nr:hypothetical protein [Myxococcales bacterium]
MRRRLAGGVGLVLCSVCALADAKDYRISTPGGHAIYDEQETFADAVDQRSRRFVVEAAVGAGPEGNVGMLLGYINWPVRGLEYYLGFGLESNPARQYTGAVRYLFNIDGYRPYVSLGYLFKDAYALGTYTHNVFGEVGYSWVLHRTYHLTAGVGVRRILSVQVRDDSPLRGSDVDPQLLDDEIDGIARWVPTFALRFSRAF